MMPARPTSPRDPLLRRSREALSALGVQFLLGMGANLIGAPQENPAASRAIAGVVLGLHVLVGVGVIVVAVRALITARRQRLGRNEATWALVVLSLTFLFGVGTMITGNDWLSFLMAAGTAVAAALYIRTAVLGARSTGVLAEG
jgi:NADH:ubiquinone oxidoreductase subunit 2 (subunit N)